MVNSIPTEPRGLTAVTRVLVTRDVFHVSQSRVTVTCQAVTEAVVPSVMTSRRVSTRTYQAKCIPVVRDGFIIAWSVNVW